MELGRPRDTNMNDILGQTRYHLRNISQGRPQIRCSEDIWSNADQEGAEDRYKWRRI